MTHGELAPRRSTRGFALIAILWLIATLSVLVGLGLATTRLGVETTSNRVLLARGRWAAEACLAIAQSRWAAGAGAVGHRLADTASFDLGQGQRCAWRVVDPTARLNVNGAERGMIAAALTELGLSAARSDSVVQKIAQRRQHRAMVNLAELDLAMELTDTLAVAFSADGPGQINLNAAPAPVLVALPGMTPEAVHRVLYRRSVDHPVESIESLAGDLSPPARAVLLSRYADLARVVTFQPRMLRLTARGWTEGQGGARGLHAEIDVLAVPSPERLAVVQRKMRT